MRSRSRGSSTLMADDMHVSLWRCPRLTAHALMQTKALLPSLPVPGC
jgi:hypothetical protein